MILKHKQQDAGTIYTALINIQRQHQVGELSSCQAFDQLRSIAFGIVSHESILFGKAVSGKVDGYTYFFSDKHDRSDLVYWTQTKNVVNDLFLHNAASMDKGSIIQGDFTSGVKDYEGLKGGYALIPTFLDKETHSFLVLLNANLSDLDDCCEILKQLAATFEMIYLSECRLGGKVEGGNGKSKNEILDMLMKYSSDAIGVFNVNWSPKFLSPSFEHLFGFTREQLMNPSFFECFRSEVKDMKKVVIDGIERYRFTNLNANKERMWLESIFDTLYDDDGEIQGHMAIVRNISEEVKGDKKMSEALEKEIALNKMKSQFISITSHEFKTPLSTIKSSIEICNIELQRQLEEHPSEQKFKKHFNRVNNEVDRMNSLLVNLLNLEKINQGVIQVSSKTKKINSYLRSVLEDWVDQDAVQFETALPDDFTHPIDVSLMNQVMTNLVENALKYGSREDDVLVRANIAEGKLIISVKDYGDGISKDEQEHLFKPFFRASNANKYDKGSGLGLMITKKFIELQNGTIHFESEVGEGTCFYLTFSLT
ncbi:hypothetical protein GCM10011339_02640 [Echinicola rosea]|uniref:histidine kinase n=2 Tax=Echinicola rosea TaxID=1807691 RepID=A0ABQ1UGE4_9BACT|nr:hypothetical protein GCM10011339_02640 [Echinicola rosea]